MFAFISLFRWFAACLFPCSATPQFISLGSETLFVHLRFFFVFLVAWFPSLFWTVWTHWYPKQVSSIYHLLCSARRWSTCSLPCHLVSLPSTNGNPLISLVSFFFYLILTLSRLNPVLLFLHPKPIQFHSLLAFDFFLYVWNIFFHHFWYHYKQFSTKSRMFNEDIQTKKTSCSALFFGYFGL